MLLSVLVIFSLFAGHSVDAAMSGLPTVSTTYVASITSVRTIRPCVRCTRAERRRLRLQSSSVRSSASRIRSASSARISSASQSGRSSSSASIAGETVRSHVVLLGETTPTLASIDLFSNAEPVDVNRVTITFTQPVPSIGSLLVYDQDGVQIGTATAVSGSSTQFRGSIGFGKLLLPYREERMLSVKARLKSKDSGGVSGESVQVQNISITGEGRWSNEEYVQTTTETFTESVTAYSRVSDAASISFANNGSAEGVLFSGTSRILADFTMTAQTPESQHPLRLIDMYFTAEKSNDVTLSNIRLMLQDGSVSTTCSILDYTVSCNSLDGELGVIDSSRRLVLRGDVTVAQNASRPYLRMVINNPGTPSTPGDITWSDGTTTFTWIDLDQPVFSGTIWR